MAEVILNNEIVYNVSDIECLFTVKIKSTKFSFFNYILWKVSEVVKPISCSL
jgi:hypothetical protein